VAQTIHAVRRPSPGVYLLASVAAETVPPAIGLRSNGPDNRVGAAVRGGDDRRAASVRMGISTGSNHVFTLPPPEWIYPSATRRLTMSVG
jgi:hypothetical protein